MVNGETILFAGGHYEQKGNEVTKYYFAGASRIAVRKYTVPQSSTLTYLAGDHLGSTSLAVDASTNAVTETRYKPWGEVRYTTADMTLPTRYTFTGQYSYMNDEATDLGAAGFGLMFYNARWYDPALGRFAQADSIVPGGLQGLDRYSYVSNNPMIYTDPSGHAQYRSDYRQQIHDKNMRAHDPVVSVVTTPGVTTSHCTDFNDYYCRVNNNAGNIEPLTFTIIICGSGNGLSCADGDGTSLNEYKKDAVSKGSHPAVFDVDKCANEHPQGYGKIQCVHEIESFISAGSPATYYFVGHSAGGAVAVRVIADIRNGIISGATVAGLILLDPDLSITNEDNTVSDLEGELRNIVGSGILTTVGVTDNNYPSSLYQSLCGYGNFTYMYYSLGTLGIDPASGTVFLDAHLKLADVALSVASANGCSQ